MKWARLAGTGAKRRQFVGRHDGRIRVAGSAGSAMVPTEEPRARSISTRAAPIRGAAVSDGGRAGDAG